MLSRPPVILTVVLALFLALNPARSDHGKGSNVITSDDINWQDGPASLPSGAKVAMLEGDPSKEGPFVLRMKLPDGFRVLPHSHPKDERVTVISGTLYLGMGDQFDAQQAKALPAGSYVRTPAGRTHFGWVKGATVLQLHGEGPWAITYVHAADDPRNGNRHVPQAEIDNGILKVRCYLPDAQKGYYRGTRFDWSGVIGSLEYQGHRYYGPWFTKTDPTVNDFIYQGADIVAGPCSAITGPVEEFLTGDQALGYEEAGPGGTFIKIGVGVLRKPREGGRYSRFQLYEIVDAGTWRVQTTRRGITFTQEVTDPSSGYGYRYEKTIQLTLGRPEMAMGHKLKNTGKRVIASSVYNHNFLILDGQPPGPDFVLKMPFAAKTKRAPNSELAEVRGNQFVYRRALRDRETVFAQLQGFGSTTADYRFTIENTKTGAGLRITGDRPLSDVFLWSIRSVLSLEPFLAMRIEPGQEFTWKYTYAYYLIEGNQK
jgi:hypothetical protein